MEGKASHRAAESEFSPKACPLEATCELGICPELCRAVGLQEYQACVYSGIETPASLLYLMEQRAMC